jgi:cyclic beta-1,2-glucan synthetase
VAFEIEKQQNHPACYDLLASEARIAYFVAIAKDDIPQESWFELGRPPLFEDGIAGLLSWTGTMFEYLMPALWMRLYPNTLLERAAEAAVRAQRAYAADKGVPAGASPNPPPANWTPPGTTITSLLACPSWPYSNLSMTAS